MCDDSKHDDGEVFKRRQFLKIGAASAAAAGLGVSSTTAHAASDRYAPPAKPGLPPSDMVLNLKRTALVVTDPQVDFLSPDGVTWGVVGESVTYHNTEQTRDSISSWIEHAELGLHDYLFKSRFSSSPHISTRQYARIVGGWVSEIGLDPAEYGTHSMRRTKASLIYRRTKNLRAVQLLLGHTKLESTVRYLGIEVDDALEMAEQTEV